MSKVPKMSTAYTTFFFVLLAASVLLSFSIFSISNFSILQGMRGEYGTYHLGPMVGEPRTLQLTRDKRIQITIKDSTSYNISTPSGKEIWKGSYPPGGGSVRLTSAGETNNDRAVFLSMYHQLHCVENFGKELVKPASERSRKNWGHLQHCFNFLREMALCRPDMTLESGDFTKWAFPAFSGEKSNDDQARTRVGGEKEDSGSPPRVCRDWQHVHNAVADNYHHWMAKKEKLEVGASRLH